MRRIALPLIALLAAAAVIAGYLPSDIGGPLVGRGGGEDFGVTVSLVVAEDGAWPLLSVRSSLGYPHKLIVRTPASDQEWVWDDEAKGALPFRHRGLDYTVVPQLTVDEDDQVRVVVLAFSEALADSMLLHDDLVNVRRGGGIGILPEAVLVGEGHVPYVAYDAGLGYERPCSVYARLINDPDGEPATVWDYDDWAIDGTAASATLSGSWWFPEEFSAVSGDSIYLKFDFGDDLEFEYGFELEAVPGAPENFTAEAVGGAVTLSWDAVPGATGYRVFRRERHDTGRVYEVSTQPGVYQVPARIQANTYGRWFADFTYFYDPAHRRFHVFGIDKYSEGTPDTQFVHISSADHVNWTVEEPITRSHLAGGNFTLVEGETSYVMSALWAPHVVLSDSTWYMFLTGVDYATYGTLAKGIQRIFYCTAALGDDLTDPVAWNNLTFALDGDCSECEGNSGSIIATSGWTLGEDWKMSCRDPYVVYDEGEDRWLMVMTLTKTGYATDALGMATADDLSGPWTLLGSIGDNSDSVFPAYPGMPPKAESPALVKLLGKWFLMYADNASKTVYVVADNPLGPYDFVLYNASGWEKYQIFGNAAEPLSGVFELSDGTTLASFPQWVGRESITCASFSLTSGEVYFYPLMADTIAGEPRLIYGSPADGYSDFVRYLPADAITGTSYVDEGIPEGRKVGYSVAAIMPGGALGGYAEVEDVTGVRSVSISEYVFFFSGYDGSANTRVQVAPVPSGSLTHRVDPCWEYRYRELIASDEITSTGLDTLDYGAWTWVHRTTPQVSIVSDPITIGQWYGIDMQIRSVSSVVATDSLRVILDRLALAPQPDWCNPGLTRDGDDFVLCWGHAAEDFEDDPREFSHYQIVYVSATTLEGYILDELGEPLQIEAGDPDEDNTWRHVGIIANDPIPNLYSYRIVAFHTRNGVLGAGRESSQKTEVIAE